MLLPGNLHAWNGRGKVTTANLQYLGEVLRNFYHVAFLKVCKTFEITPIGFNIKKTLGIGRPSTVKTFHYCGRRN